MSRKIMFGALGTAFAAGLGLLTISSGLLGSTSDHHLDASIADTEPSNNGVISDEPVVALADPANRALLNLTGSTTDDDPNQGETSVTSAPADTAENEPGAISDDATSDDAAPRSSVLTATTVEPAAPAAAETTTSPAAPEATPATEAEASTSANTAATGANQPGDETDTGSPERSPNDSPSSTAAPTTAAPTTAAPTTAAPTTAAPTTAAPTTAAPTTAAPTTAAPTTAAPPAPRRPSSGELESVRNNDPSFSRFSALRSTDLPLGTLFTTADRPDNGPHSDGTFRMSCNYSHFAYDDPIIKPNQPGESHLHMFFGNTAVNAFTTTDSLMNSGGGSCQGFELNRSGYWTPAVLDGRGNAVVPDRIVLYYKSKFQHKIQPMPAGLKMVVGNIDNETFTADQYLGWACGSSGVSYNRSNRIPNNCGSDPINFHVVFPECWDGKNLDSPDHRSHMYFVDPVNECPTSHPVRLPQITILAYFPPGDTSGWHLSSDRSDGFNTGPGATLHADWFGGWNDEALNTWINGCMRASRNCSNGQTGTSRQFASLGNGDTYTGPNFLPLP